MSGVGPVGDAEGLVRIIYAPQFWDEIHGVVKPAAFQEAGTSGLSVTRLEHATDETLTGQVLARVVAGQNRMFVKLVRTTLGDIKTVMSEGRRAFCCYDTPNASNSAHADICQAHAPAKKSEQSEMRRELQKLFVHYEWDWSNHAPRPSSP